MDRRIESAIRTIERQLHRNFSVVELAQEVHLSPWYFIHLFKAETSLTPKRYILECRMTRAEELLQNSFLSVKEVAAKVGFTDPSHFSREFKKYRGAAPTSVRERRQLAG